MIPHSTKIVRKIRRNDTEISRCIKYLMFGFNILFWVKKYFFLLNKTKNNFHLDSRIYDWCNWYLCMD